LKKLNTVVATITTVYAVSKFMYTTFKKYEEKHGNSKNKCNSKINVN
jgi:hypothetical protein